MEQLQGQLGAADSTLQEEAQMLRAELDHLRLSAAGDAESLRTLTQENER